MPIDLYGLVGSPPCLSVLLTAKSIGLELQLKPVNLMAGDHKTEDYLKKNPAHTIPVLDDNGFVLFESRAIMAYLVDTYGKDDKLYPKDIKKRAVVNNMMFFDLGTLYQNVAFSFYPQMFFGSPPDPEKLAVFKEKLSVLDRILAQRPYFAGDHLTIADISLVNTFAIPEAFKFPFSDYPNIWKYYQKMSKEIPFYEQLTKEGKKDLNDFIQSLKVKK